MKDVKHNTVYYANWHNTKYLVLYDEDNHAQDKFLNLSNIHTYGSSGCFSTISTFYNYLHEHIDGITVREATPIEDRWLRKCIEVGMYVDCPKEEIINHYEIY